MFRKIDIFKFERPLYAITVQILHPMSPSIFFKVIAKCLSLTFLIFALISCDEEEKEAPQVAPSITNFSPAIGLPGTIVTINGKNFDASPANNTVKFSNALATVDAATATSLTVVVPEDATTGKIEVTVNNRSTFSAADFVIPPVITDFAPKSGVAGSNVTITGKGFSSTVANNIVKVNGKTATVTAASATSITIQVPADGYSGTISLEIGVASVTTTEIFKYIPSITTFEPLRGPANAEVTIVGSGFSLDPESNIVKIGDVAAEVISAMANELVIKVAEGTQTGNITVAYNGSVAMSPLPFTIFFEAWRAGAGNSDAGFSIGVDGAGNSYVTGSYWETTSFGSTVLTGENEQIFVAKYDPEGELVWVVDAGSSSHDRGMSLVVDNAGNSYITGYFAGTVDFGPFSKSTNVGSLDVFVAKLNTSGIFQWVESFGSVDTDMGHDITLDGNGNVIVVGGFWETVSVGATDLTSAGQRSTFVAKFNGSTGSPTWAKTFGGALDDAGMAVSVNNDGDIFVGGDFFGSITIGSSTFTAGSSILNSFIMKLDDLGVLLWSKPISGAGWNNVIDISSDANGNCVATGYFSGATTIGATPLNGGGYETVFLTKLASADGGVMFAEKAGGGSYANGRGLALDQAGNIYLAGYFEREATFGTSTVNAEKNSRDAFIAKYEADGELVWVESAGGDESDQAYGVAVTSEGMIYLTGSYRDFDSKFGATILENQGSDDLFVYRIPQ